MDTNLYNLLISTGLSEEKARAEASKYISKEQVKIKPKQSLINFVTETANQGIKERLQVSVSLLKVLGVEYNQDMVETIQGFEAEPVEILRRFSGVIESKMLPQRSKDNKLQSIADELMGVVNPPTVTSVGDDDPLLMAVQNELANNEVVVPDLEEVSVVDIIDEVEEETEDQFGNELDNEQDERIVTVLGQPIAPTFPPM